MASSSLFSIESQKALGRPGAFFLNILQNRHKNGHSAVHLGLNPGSFLRGVDMKQAFWIFFALLVVSVANAKDYGVMGFGYWSPIRIQEYLTAVDKVAPVLGAQKCQNVYSNAVKKGVLDIRYALGYFDASQGQDVIWSGINFGLSPSLDIEVFNAIRKEFTKSCASKSLRTCGFIESGDPASGKVILQKHVKWYGAPVLVRLTLTQASATKSYYQNIGSSVERQKFLTAQSEENFFGGLANADIVIYNGHSRDGGGPDFNPPILKSNLKVDYEGYYQVERPGLLKTLHRLSSGSNKESVLGLFSCYSKLHFREPILRANPRQRMVLSADLINYLETLMASVGYLEGFLRGSCGQELADLAKQGEKMQKSFFGYNIN